MRERELHHPLFCWHYSTVHVENLQKCLCGKPSRIIHIFSTKTALAAARWANGATKVQPHSSSEAVSTRLLSAAALTLNSGCFYKLGLKTSVLKKTSPPLGLKMDSPWVAAGHHLEARGVAEQFVQGADDTGELGPQVSLLHPAFKHQLVQHHGAIHGRG